MSSLHIKDTISGPGYDIRITDGFDALASFISKSSLEAGKALIVTDSKVGPLYLNQVMEAVGPCFDQVDRMVIPEGEENKNLNSVKDILLKLVSLKYDRKDLVIALGGGVIGDMAGFASAIFLRGIRFLQIPTTLLSQTDSSIGGKTGVDLEGYKNMVGAFHQPAGVFINVSVLDSLDVTQFSSGMAEIIKHGLIRDRDFFDWLIFNADSIRNKDKAILAEMIERSLNIKSVVVEEDPTEKGIRAILNFGHTLGHAIEKFLCFKLTHGQCVGLGMMAAPRISLERGIISGDDLDSIERALKAFGLPVRLSERIDANEILKISKSDKKMEKGKIKFILLKKMGEAVIDTTVTDEEILLAIDSINGPNREHIN